MEVVLTVVLIALHTGPDGCFRLLPGLLADVAFLMKPFARYGVDHDWLHGGHISKSYFRNIQCTDNMGPASVVALLQCSIPLRTEFASDTSCTFLRFALSTKPRAL